MAAGLPVVISDKVNIWREIKDSGAGLVGACDADQFTRMMREILDQPEMAQQLGTKGKDLVKRKFEWSTVVLRLEQVYQSIILGHPIEAVSDSASTQIPEAFATQSTIGGHLR